MMLFSKSLFVASLALATALPSLAMTHSRRGPTSPRGFNKHSKAPATPPRQHAIDDTRATEIQQSLIKSGYLSGEASGHWDNQTEAAMQKFQNDNGWQTKLIPDSRAIIKLGLGPTQDSGMSNTSASGAGPEMPSSSAYLQK
jgi:peptidoglycan hydrolase-like protein with peptidoglycan-binding domain